MKSYSARTDSVSRAVRAFPRPVSIFVSIFSSLQRLIRDVWNMGFDAVRWLWQYFLLGAVIVIPIWLILRLVRAPKGR